MSKRMISESFFAPKNVAVIGATKKFGFGFGIPYTDEFKTTGVNMPLLDHLASLTHGKVLPLNETPESLFSVQSDIKEYGRPLWPLITLAFLLLLLVDVTVRKLLSLGERETAR